jgi:hypothetical protein
MLRVMRLGWGGLLRPAMPRKAPRLERRGDDAGYSTAHTLASAPTSPAAPHAPSHEIYAM